MSTTSTVSQQTWRIFWLCQLRIRRVRLLKASMHACSSSPHETFLPMRPSPGDKRLDEWASSDKLSSWSATPRHHSHRSLDALPSLPASG